MACFLPCPELGNNVVVSKEEFFSFHNIDRQLFTRLVVELGRDTSQSTHVMAFIMWLEKQCKDMNMIKNMTQWPSTTLASLADETVLVLSCIESSQFPYDYVGNDETLLIMKNLLRNNAANLKYFYDNRMIIIGAVTKLLNNVCARAFADIVQEVQYMKAMKEHNLQISNVYQTNPYGKQVVYYTPMPGGVTFVPQHVGIPALSQWGEGGSSSREINANTNPREELDQNFDYILDMINETSISDKKKKDLSIDDRIIFMTFSKGYPISEVEVRDFFTRRYGKIIESFHMQEVIPPQQPLYARIVIHPEAAHLIDHLLENTDKVKLSINGKHAWARKYVRKGTKYPITF